MLFHINGPRKKVEAQKNESSIELMDWLVPHYTRSHTQLAILRVHFNTGGKTCPRSASCTWCTVLDREIQKEAKSTVSPFHSTHHCSLQHRTRRNSDCIAQRKWEYFHFCCFKVSISAHLPTGWGDDFQHQWLFRPELHWLFSEPAVQFSLLAFSCVLNRASTICCWRKHWTQEWAKCPAESTGIVKIALPGNWSEWAGGHKELRCPRLRACLKPFHHRLEVKRQHSSLLKS